MKNGAAGAQGKKGPGKKGVWGKGGGKKGKTAKGKGEQIFPGVFIPLNGGSRSRPLFFVFPFLPPKIFPLPPSGKGDMGFWGPQMAYRGVKTRPPKPPLPFSPVLKKGVIPIMFFLGMWGLFKRGHY